MMILQSFVVWRLMHVERMIGRLDLAFGDPASTIVKRTALSRTVSGEHCESLVFRGHASPCNLSTRDSVCTWLFSSVKNPVE